MNSPEIQERKIEQRERKEHEKDPELTAASAMERADFISKEVKNSKSQMQNIVMNMQAVLTAIRDLRAALQITADPNQTDESSITQDQKRVLLLKKRIAEYRTELLKMKDDLIVEQTNFLRKQQPTVGTELLQAQAEKMVAEILAEAEET